MINKKFNNKAGKQMLLSIVWTLGIFITTGIIPGFAQKPSNLPSSNGDPVDFLGSLTNILVYIVLPLAIVILYVIWRKRKIKEAMEEKDEIEKQSNQNNENPNS